MSDLTARGYLMDEMQLKSDAQLLSEYARQGVEPAFAEIVARHTNLVYSAALRQVSSTDLAAEVSQGVFIALARSAVDLSRKLDMNASLAGWLCRTARNIALNTRRVEIRRQSREKQAMQIIDSNCDSAPDWTVLCPVLDSAMSELNDADQDALVLRYFKNQGLRDVGRALGVSDDTAQKRVARALDKLHGILSKRGITSSAASLSVLLSTHAIQAAPAGLSEIFSSAFSSATKTSAASQAVTTLRSITMTTTQKMLIALGVVSFIGIATFTSYDSTSLVSDQRAISDLPVSPAPAEGRSAERVIPPGPGPNRSTSGIPQPDEKLAADLRAAIRDVPASRLGTRSYPPETVIQALLAFGPNRSQAFVVVKEALNDPDPEIRKRAFSTLGFLGTASTPELAQFGVVGDPAPEAKPLLWKTLQNTDSELAPLALSSLQMIGFEGNEIPTLTSLLSKTENEQLRRYLPEAISRTIQKDAAEAAPFLPQVQALLDHPDSALQFAAACALAQDQASNNPKILPTLTSGLQNPSSTTQLMALETLQRLGPIAEHALQALLDFGDTTTDQVLKDLAFKTIGKINSETRATLPEVNESLKHEESLARWQEKFDSGNYVRQDLLEALKEPLFSTIAAQKLAELGSAARDTLPNLIAALAGKDQTARERIAEAIHQIDPETPILKVDSRTIAAAATAASLESAANQASQENSLEKLLEKSRMMNSEWQTQEELVSLAKAIAAESPEAYRTFANKVVELEPALGELLPLRTEKQ